ncbi:MAG: phosphatase PAP2 family protein [Bacteroidota bacterium]
MERIEAKKLTSINEFLMGTGIFGLLGAIILALSSKGDILLSLNNHVAPHADDFFKSYTHLGLGALLAIFAVVFLFIRYYYSIMFMASLISAGIIVFISKKYLFSHLYRPSKNIDLTTLPNVVEGINFHSYGSFPSGHTLTAFAGATILALASRKKGVGYLLITLAVGVAISRVYLLQHYFMDVYAGGLIGVAVVLGLHFWLRPYYPRLKSNLVTDYFLYRRKRIRAKAQFSTD